MRRFVTFFITTRRFTPIAAVLALAVSGYVAFAAISLSTSVTSTQNFDGIGTSATASLPADFRVDAPTAVRTVGTFSAAGTATARVGGASLATNAANGIYNFGAGTTTAGPDRAVGFLSSGTATASGNLYAQLINSTGAALTGLQISYNVEKYRGGSNTAGYRIQLFYSTDGTTWTSAGNNFLTTFAADATNNGFTTAPGETVAVNQALNVAIPNSTNFYLAWNYSVTSGSTTTNAQALAIDDISILGLGGGASPTNPTGTGSATPNSVQAGNSSLLAVAVTPGTNPVSTGISVVADLSAIGGAASQPFFDDGSNGDAVAGNNVFSFQATIPTGTVAGAKSLPIAISDAQLRAGATTIALTVQPPGAGKVMINEIDADTPGSDTAEFIELYDGGSGNTPLDGLVVVLYDGLSSGSGNQSYAAFDLSGYATDSDGYFVLGNPGVPSASIVFDPGPFGLLQNGPDAVALYIGRAIDFPNGTVLTTTNLLDAIVYGTDDFSASGLLPLLNAGQKIVNEDATGNSQTQSSQRCPAGMGGLRNTSPYYPGTPTPGAANNCPAARPPSDVVISQIYGGGGNTSAIFQNDYVELYNRGSALVDLTGWSLQYSSATGSSWDLNRQPIGGVIGPGEYYLIALASGGANGVPLSVTPNVSSQINIAAGSGNVALVSSYAGLVGACPIFDPSVKDLVGYGSADCGEGSATAPGLSNTTAIFRKNNGSQDTDNNANDVDAPTPPNPRRTAPVVELGPAVLTTDPTTNATSAPRDATILVTFTEAVSVDSGWFSLTCASSGAHSSATFAANRGGQDQYITSNNNFTAGEPCTVTIFKDRVHDVDLDDSAPNTDTLTADYSWSFTVATGTAPPEPPEVHVTLGNPSGANTGDSDNDLMLKPEFALSYNRDLGRPNWVSWHLTDEWIGTLTRVDTFRPDPQVPPDWYRVQSFDFSGSGFDRGHMTPNADRDKETSIPINQATFLMSNMVAQAPNNNQGPWADLEGYLRTLVTQGNEIYIVSGPAGVGGTGSLGGVTNTLANGHVTVPASTWKVALVLPKADGDDLSRVSCSTRTIAVIMPNTQTINSDWMTYLTTVDAVETLTGYDFFSNLPAPIQQCVEAGTNGNNPPLVKGDQTITFPPPPESSYGDPAFTISASGGASGSPVTFAASGVCTAAGSNGATITTTAAGPCTITASQAGSDLYNAAADAVQTFAVGAAPLAVTAASASREYGAANPVLTGTLTGVVDGDNITASYSTTAGPASLPGEYPIVVSLSDPAGRLANYNVTAHNGVLTIVDTTPPAVLSVTPSVTSIWPPNKRMIPVSIAVSAMDNLDPSPACHVVSVTSNEGSSADWQITGPLSVSLRADRAGGGNGRVYTITAQCADAFGNTASAATAVVVPHDQGKGK